MADQVLEFAEALAVVLREAAGVAAPSKVEDVKLLDATGRVLAKAIVADRDQPPFDRSTRDGFAVRATDVGESLKVVGQVRAGERWTGAAVGAGEAVEIMTGAPMPKGADAVVMVEHTSLTDGMLRVEAGRVLKAGENVVPRGAEARMGASLLPVGRVMGPAEIAVAASCGAATVSVFARPMVGIVATGDELVEVGGEHTPRAPSAGDARYPDPEGPGYLEAEARERTSHLSSTMKPSSEDGAPSGLREFEIYNSNSYAISALVKAEGGAAARLAIARDSFAELKERVERGMAADLLVLSGGVSMGKYDLVEHVLAELGAEFLFTGAKIQPGKPVVFGRLPTFDAQRPWVYFFGLPGNPVSTQVCFALFVGPMLRALAGRREVAPVFVEAKLAEDVRGGAKVMRFLPAELSGGWDGVTVRLVGWQGSGDVAANARGNCYCVLPLGVDAFAKGDVVRVLLR